MRERAEPFLIVIRGYHGDLRGICWDRPSQSLISRHSLNNNNNNRSGNNKSNTDVDNDGGRMEKQPAAVVSNYQLGCIFSFDVEHTRYGILRTDCGWWPSFQGRPSLFD